MKVEQINDYLFSDTSKKMKIKGVVESIAMVNIPEIIVFKVHTSRKMNKREKPTKISKLASGLTIA
jgi:hypothetical protein